MRKILLILFTAPSATPENITITGITSRSISLSWDPPHPDDQNGIIQQYIISINEIITNNAFTVTSTTTSVLIENLHPFYSYTISLAAETTEVGPFSPMISVDLPEDGKFTYLLYNTGYNIPCI